MTTFIRTSLERKRRLLDNGEKGFTLIELLVVVLIIGVLAAIAIPIYLSTQDTAKDNAVKSAVTEAKTAAVAYFTEEGEFPESLEGLPGYSSSSEITVAFVGDADINGFCIEGSYDDAEDKTWSIRHNTSAEKEACGE